MKLNIIPNSNINLNLMNPNLKNEPLSNVYQIYSPYLKNPPKKQKYEEKHSKYIKQLEKYYEYNHYKPKKIILDHSQRVDQKIIPNRKLSPIAKKQIIRI